MAAFTPLSVGDSIDCDPGELLDASPGGVSLNRKAQPARRRWLMLSMLGLALAIAIAAGVAALRGTGWKSSVLGFFGVSHGAAAHPTVTASRPGLDAGLVACDTFIAADVQLPNAGAVVDPDTINSGSVRLVRAGDATQVPARVNTSAAGDSIVLQPDQPLDPNSAYKFEVLPALKDTSGASFKYYSVVFTTGGAVPTSRLAVAFDKTELPATAGHMYTGLTFGPDKALYACTYDGQIFCFTLAADGTIASAKTMDAVRVANGGPRLITGICFDPASTADHPILYVSHGQCTRTGADDWTGKLSRLSGAALNHYEDVLVGLPRASRDHLNNQMAFGPDGALYLAQGSNTAMGAPDASWGMRPERLLSASILRVDLARVAAAPPLDVRTEAGGHYNPYADDAAVTLYATGVRNAFDLLWHRNGKLYAPINGSAAGGNTPASPDGRVPALNNLRVTVPDHLAVIRQGDYHGHPNPARGQYVLMGGNPTAGLDGDAIAHYPVGTVPESNWNPPALTFGRNLCPVGLIEYHASADGPLAMLDGAIFVCRHSGGKDVAVLMPAIDGSIAEMITGVDGLTRFADPIDIAQSPTTGHLYVAELGGKKITLVRARANSESGRVFRQPVSQERGPIEMLPQHGESSGDLEETHPD